LRENHGCYGYVDAAVGDGQRECDEVLGDKDCVGCNEADLCGTVISRISAQRQRCRSSVARVHRPT
jgi:hypothetical protein